MTQEMPSRPESALSCRICGRHGMLPGLDLGPQPIANRFKKSAAEPDYRHPLAISQCKFCGLVQLAEAFPSDELRPRLEWIRYREREDHLDKAVASFLPFFAGAENPVVFGLTDYDRVLFQALQKQRPESSYLQLSSADLAVSETHYGMETIQRALSPERARLFVEKSGRAQIMISRYLFEHSATPLSLLAAYRELLADDGFLLLEVPDSEAPLERCDYPMIWEEHVSYYTESSLRFALENNGFSTLSIFKATSKFESPLMILAQKQTKKPTNVDVAPSELTRFEKFSENFSTTRTWVQSFCQRNKEAGFSIVLFGAGHFTVAFANFFSMEPWLTCVIDDDPNKSGKFLAGTSLPIVSSEAMTQGRPVLALLCVNPDVEAKVMEKLARFSRDGDRQYSIFTASPRSCLHE